MFRLALIRDTILKPEIRKDPYNKGHLASVAVDLGSGVAMMGVWPQPPLLKMEVGTTDPVF